MKRINAWALVALAFASVASLSASGKTVYVSPNGSGDQSGSSPENACAGITAGYRKADVGDTIQLASDTYPFAEGDQVTLGKADLTVQGDAAHPENVILDGGGNNVGFFKLTKATTLRGMTLRNAIAENTFQAVSISGSGGVCVDFCVFSGLTNAAAGAAIATTSAVTLFVSNTTFTACATTSETSSVNGGAVSVNQKNARAYYADCVFKGCSAGYGAGAICGYTRIDGCHFENCTAKKGGGGALAKNVLPDPVVSNCTFLANALTDSAAEYSGGAVWVGSDTVFEGCTFRTNASEKASGALHASGGEITLRRCKFYGNSAASGYGAASGAATVEDCIFEGNKTDSSDAGALGATYSKGPARVVRTVFRGNAALNGHGGAIYVNNKTNLFVSACSFVGNTNVYNSCGGAIYANQSWLEVRNSLFAKNYTGHKGPSAIDVNKDKANSALIENCSFVSNVVDAAVGGHGALNKTAGIFTVTNCIFYSNIDLLNHAVCNFYSSQDLAGFGYCASDDDKLAEIPGCLKLTKYPFASGDDFRLRRHAEPVDKGLQLPWMTADAKELAGNVRVYGVAPDMGCYEWAPRVGFMLLLR